MGRYLKEIRLKKIYKPRQARVITSGIRAGRFILKSSGFKRILIFAMELNSNRPPILERTNFDHWKAKMIAYLKAIDEDVWNACVVKYTPPKVTVDGVTTPKPNASYTPAEKSERAANSRALNVLFTYVDTKEFHRISTCKLAKEAWDILVTTHEGTTIVKQGKLQRVSTQFEMIRMEEDETFDEVYAKLNHIVNTSYTLGEPITPFRVVKKILRSLPARFKTKVDILESKRKLPEMSVEEIVGQFQNYELTYLDQDITSTKTFENSIAFSSKQNEPNDSDGDDNYDMEALDLFMKNFKHFFKKKNYKNENNSKKSKGKIEFSNSRERKGVKGPPSGPKCYECHGYGHLAQDCANKKMKQKVYNVKTWDDDSVSEKSESDRDEDSGKNYLAFAAKHQTDKKGSETKEDSEVEEEAVDFDDLQVAYNMLYKESLKIKKKYVRHNFGYFG